MQKPNIASRLLGALGLHALFRSQAAADESMLGAIAAQSQLGRTRRPGRNVGAHRRAKQDFNNDLESMIKAGKQPRHLKVARKAALGTLTIPGGRRGLQARYHGRKNGNVVYRITA